MSFAGIGVGVAAIGVGTSAIGARNAAKDSKKSSNIQNQALVEQMRRRERIANQLEAVANKILNEEPISPREQALISAASNVADQQLKRIQKESIASSLEAQAGTGFLSSKRMSDQVRRLVLEGAEGRSRIAVGREQAINDAILRNRQQALQALQSAGGFNTAPQFSQPVGNPLAGLGAGLTSLGGAGIQFGSQQAGLDKFLASLKGQNQTQIGETSGLPTGGPITVPPGVF